MKLDEDMGRDRGDDFQTDDEENEAELVNGDEDFTESEDTISSPSPSVNDNDLSNYTWPQSYRQSIGRLTTVAPPYLSFLRKTSLTGISNFFSTAQESPEASDHDSLLSKPLLSETSIDKEVPTSVPPVKISASAFSKFSTRKSPPPQEQCSLAQAVINGINVLCGIGLLTTPYAVKEGGWFSLIILVILGLLSCHTAFLLKRCLESSPELRTYPDIGEAAFGLAGRFGIAIVLYIELYASCVEYIIMMSDNLASLYPNTKIRFAGTYLGSHQVFAIIATLFVLPTVWLRNLSLLSYLSGGGVVASILLALCLLWVGVVDRVGFHPCGTALDLATISVSVGIFGFSFSGHPVFPNIYTSMKEPSQFQSVLIASFVFCLFMYTGVAICGFLMFGDSIKSQFTLNMPREYVASNIAIWTVVVNPLTKYALTLTPISLSLEELLPSARLRSFSAVILVRTILVFSTLVVALAFPFFASVMALMGSLLTMLVTFIFPCACYLCLLKGKLTKLQIANSIIILGVALVCLFIGTYSAIIRISDKIA